MDVVKMGNRKNKREAKRLKEMNLRLSLEKKAIEEKRTLDLVKKAMMGDKVREENQIRDIARKIIDARKKIQLKEVELKKKEAALTKDELSNSEKASRDPPAPPKELAPQIAEIEVVKDSIEAKNNYLNDLIEFAQSEYPDIFKRQ